MRTLPISKVSTVENGRYERLHCRPWYCVVVGCCLATKSFHLNNMKWKGCGNELLAVTSNK